MKYDSRKECGKPLTGARENVCPEHGIQAAGRIAVSLGRSKITFHCRKKVRRA